MPVYEPKREDEVYRNVTESNHGPLPAEAVKRIFERMIDEMRTLQKMRMQALDVRRNAGGRDRRADSERHRPPGGAEFHRASFHRAWCTPCSAV